MNATDADAPVSRRGFLTTAAGTAAIAGAGGTVAAQEGNSSSAGSGGGGTKTVELVDFAFDPGTESPLVIAPGTTVKFVWNTGGHNIHVDQQPDGANWSGHESIEDSGFTYTHTFQTTGKYHYWCTPHKSQGMVADIQVKQGGASASATSGGGGLTLPDSAKNLGIAAMSFMLSTLGLAYFFMRFGGDFETAEE